MTRSLLALILMCSTANATITPALIESIIAIESSGKPDARGDQGAGLGVAQFHYAAWQDTSTWRLRQGLPTYPYHKALDPMLAREYLHSWLTLNKHRFEDHTGRKAKPADLYAIHNLGFNGYRKRGFDLRKCPAITIRKSKLLKS